MIKVVILDLDGTLIDTSALEEMRRAGKWGQIPRYFNQCFVHEDILGILNMARASGVCIAVLTNSPSRYAERLLQHFEISIDFLVAYHDVTNHKPHQEGVEVILNHFDISPEEAIYVGDSELDKDTAANANVEFFPADWITTTGIDRGKADAGMLSEIIGEKLSSKQLEQNPRAKLLQTGNKLFLGYYLDGLKQEVWAFKNGVHAAVNRWACKAAELSDSFPDVDVVVRALGHSEKMTEGNNTPLDLLSSRIAESLNAKYLPQILYKNRVLKKSTFCSAQERREQLYLAYSAKRVEAANIVGDNFSILVVDDVNTSGATSEEISRAIFKTYPRARIYVFTLVKTLYRQEANRQSAELQHNTQLYSDLYTPISTVKDKLVRPWPTESKSSGGRLESKKFSANYTNTNHNFVFNNLPRYSIASEPASNTLFGVVQILKNILQRGKPTVASRHLRQSFGLNINENGHEPTPLALISQRTVEWQRLIRGELKTENYPAKYFFDSLFAKHLGSYKFVKQLTVPEVQIFDMTQVYVERFQNKQVDFFIPHIGLIVEVDGPQHRTSREDDESRDEFTQTLGLKTIRFTSAEIQSENTNFVKKMEWINSYIGYIDKLEQDGLINPPNGITLQRYRETFELGVDPTDIRLRLTASIRFQLLLLELLERGVLRLGEKKRLLIVNRDGIEFVEQALNDFNELLEHCLRLQELNSPLLRVDIEQLSELPSKRDSTDIVIDFSLLQRFSDEHQANHGVVYARTDYFDFYRHFPAGHVGSIETSVLSDYDYFELSCSSPITYSLDLSPESTQRESLRYFLCNFFLPYLEDADFREGQVGIIGSALSRNSTIGLLPTGSGKSICYQLSAMLQPSVSFVVCPIKSLMYDQKADLDSIGFTRSNYITSDLNAEEKSRIQNDFGRGKYFFVFISPERFQTQAFRDQMSSIGLDLSFAYAVIDEAHCLSEWGHDFRTSYLNLANTIDKFAPSTSYIGLTATASVNVLKDIQGEFNVFDEFVRTPLNFTRKELSFHVLDDKRRKQDALVSLVSQMEKKWNSGREKSKKAGIIFTPTVNGDKGCYGLAGHLSSVLKQDVRFYSGSAPKTSGLNSADFDKYKRQVQDDFKGNKYNLLTATKAFGMGVNKGNIAYTIHYGIPGSMEALYQEAGRAGRNKQLFREAAADCCVLLSKESNKESLDKIWDASTKVDDLKAHISNLDRASDVNTNLFLMTVDLDSINNEYKLLYKIYQFFQANQEYQSISIAARNFGVTKSKLEKSIYRLSQLGIVSDWIVEDFFGGVLLVEFKRLSEEELETNLVSTIRKYEPTFEFRDLYVSDNTFYRHIYSRLQTGKINKTQFVLLALLLWSYDHFSYNRRQSLKTVYDQCCDLADGNIDEAEFKNRLEGYFRFDESSQLLLNLAENSANTELWLSVFFEEATSFTVIDNPTIIAPSELSKLREQLARFLESYKDNACLNYLSGIIRLEADQFNDADGRRRIASAFDYLLMHKGDSAVGLIKQTLKLKTLFSDDAKSQYAQLVYEKFGDLSLLEMINEEFGDAFSYQTLLAPLAARLKKITNSYQGINW